MTYDEAVSFWYGRINFEVRAATPQDLKMERMRALLRILGDPHERLRSLHITGTKGKGSTAAFLDAILRAAGYRVGLFTSPHLVRVEERIVVDGNPISSQELAVRMTEIAAAVRELDAGPGPPTTFFEIGTALGFLHFACRRTDFAVIEVGLGGRFDSTNVCWPLVSVITSVGLDHTAQLGTTLEAIAYQKSGIIKPRVPVVSGVLTPGPRAVIEREARKHHTPLRLLGLDFDFVYRPATGDGCPQVQLGSTRGSSATFDLGLLGEHQAANAAVACEAIDVLRCAGVVVPDSAVRRGLRELRWPARVEVVARKPAIVLDSAHNVPSAEALVKTLRESFPGVGRRAVVFAVSADKEYADILTILGEYFDHFHLTKYGNNPRCVAPERLVEALAAVAPSRTRTVHPTAADAWTAARSAAGPDDLVCVTGSMFLAGELSSAVRGSG